LVGALRHAAEQDVMPHGWVPDRIGRVRTLRLSCWRWGWGTRSPPRRRRSRFLLAGRALVGASSAGLVPGALVLSAGAGARCRPSIGRRGGRVPGAAGAPKAGAHRRCGLRARACRRRTSRQAQPGSTRLTASR
jgi:hypothetical protein